MGPHLQPIVKMKFNKTTVSFLAAGVLLGVIFNDRIRASVPGAKSLPRV